MKSKKNQMKKELKRKISSAKTKALKELIGMIEKYPTIVVSSIENLPSKQMQKIRHILRKDIVMKIVKKNMAIMAFEEAKKENIKEMAKYVEKNSVILFSNIDPYEIASLFSENRFPIKAKPGQAANDDIIIEAGPTDLMPGPAISELSGVGLKTGVEGGKISIKETKVIVKAGQKISKNVADVLMKLDIQPFKIGLEIKAAYDNKDKKVYTDIKIDKEGFTNQLIGSYLAARQFAANIEYATKETITLIIARAQREALALEKLASQAQATEENK
jgi:large subunit ribosomal protein L10